MEELKNLFFDMDDTIADFSSEKNAVARFRFEKGFFYNLKPLKVNLYCMQQLILKGYNVYIVSKSPCKRCNNDKRKWLKENVQGLKDENIIFVPLKKSKVDYVRKALKIPKNETLKGTLFDDYSKNCFEWTTSDKIKGNAFIVNPKIESSLYNTLKMLQLL